MNILALLKLIGAAARFSAIAKWFAWIPGGQLIAILGSIAGLAVSLVTWLLRDITDAFKEPQRLVVRAACILAGIGFGFYAGVRHDAELVASARLETVQWQTAHRQLLTDSKAIDAADKTRHEKALAAKMKAESDERAKIEAEKKVPAGSPYMQVKPVTTVPVKPEPAKPDAATAAKPDTAVVQPKPARKSTHCANRGGQSDLFGLQPIWGGSLSCKSI